MKHPEPSRTTESASRRSVQPVCSALTGLQFALCALAAFRRRHVWKERGSRKGLLVRNRIKDLSRSGENRDACKVWIADARKAGFRGSIIAQVISQNDQAQARDLGEPKT